MNDILSFATIRMDLEDITLSEISQTPFYSAPNNLWDNTEISQNHILKIKEVLNLDSLATYRSGQVTVPEDMGHRFSASLAKGSQVTQSELPHLLNGKTLTVFRPFKA